MRLIMLLSLLLLGCTSPDGDTPTRQQIRLQLVADPVEVSAYRDLIAAFEAQNPDIEVSMRTIGRQREHVTQLATAFAGGSPPDLFLIN